MKCALRCTCLAAFNLRNKETERGRLDDHMFIFLAALLALVAIGVVAYPIITRGRQLSGDGGGSTELSEQDKVEELLAQRDAAFQALRELSFDHQVGKITDEDFAAFETNLKSSAAASLRALDRWEEEVDRSLGAEEEDELLARVAALRAGQFHCPACGRVVSAAESFCAGCGAALTAPSVPLVQPFAVECANCGRPSQPGDRFCAGCGKPLPELRVTSG